MEHRTDCADAVNAFGEDLYNQEMILKGFNINNKPGALLDVEGKWGEDKYGRAFTVKSSLQEARKISENDKNGDEHINAEDEISILSDIIGNIDGTPGIRTAKIIVEALSPDAVKKIDSDPDIITTVSGISTRKKGEIRKAYINSRIKALRIKELKVMGLSTRKSSMVFEKLGVSSVDILKRKPFELSDMLGYQTVIKLIENNQLPYTEKDKTGAFLIHILKEFEKAGHCCMPYTSWCKAAADFIRCSPMTLEQAVKDLASSENPKVVISSIAGVNFVYRQETYAAENNTANLLLELLGMKSYNLPTDVISKDIADMEQEAGFELAPEQKNAVVTALENSLSVITGGPGTGKSTIIHFIRTIYQKHFGDNILMLAPTGKAARRMQETTGCRATTVHKGLKLKVNEAGEFYSPHTLDADFIIIDEFSMTDIFLAEMLFSSVKNGSKVVIVGDVEQLPSVGAGSVLKDIIDSSAVPVAVLSKVYRQKGNSSIAINANLMKHGNTDFEDDECYHFIPAKSFDDAADIIERLYIDESKRVGLDNVIFLSPHRKTASATSVNSFNERIHDKINPPSAEKPEIRTNTKFFRVGDRVMQTVNTPLVSNGEVGYIKEISANKAKIEFESGEIVEYDKFALDATIELAYATTVHKSQGSEYKVVIFNLQDEHGVMKKRNLIYTAITRAKEKVIIVGTKKAIIDAVNCSGNDTDKRLTMLAARLRNMV